MDKPVLSRISRLVAPLSLKRRGLVQAYLQQLAALQPIGGQAFCERLYGQVGDDRDRRNLFISTLSYFLPCATSSVRAHWGTRFERMPTAHGYTLSLHLLAMRLLAENLKLKQELSRLKAR